MTPKIISLASGSKANCTLVSAGGTSILIDLGVSCKKAKTSLSEAGVDISKIDAVFLTHEHCDHVAGLPTFMKNYTAPVYIARPSYLDFIRGKGFDYRDRMTVTETDFCMTVGALKVSAMPVRHDSAACLAYKIEGDDFSLGICTDVGCPTDDLFEFFCNCTHVITEANYDEPMLRLGSYPQTLKYRIMSESGHTSNDDCAKFVAKLAKSGVKNVLLAHVSPENNTPELALHLVSMELRKQGLSLDFLAAAPRDEGIYFQLS